MMKHRWIIILGISINLLIFLFFAYTEADLLLLNIDYRWHYLLLIYYLLPISLLIEISMLIGLDKWGIKLAIRDIIPLLLSLVIFGVIFRFEGNIAPLLLSGILLAIFSLQVLLGILRIIGVRQARGSGKEKK